MREEKNRVVLPSATRKSCRHGHPRSNVYSSLYPTVYNRKTPQRLLPPEHWLPMMQPNPERRCQEDRSHHLHSPERTYLCRKARTKRVELAFPCMWQACSGGNGKRLIRSIELLYSAVQLSPLAFGSMLGGCAWNLELFQCLKSSGS